MTDHLDEATKPGLRDRKKARRRDEIIAAMAATAKPYFGDVAEMTYLQWLRRYVELAIGAGDSNLDVMTQKAVQFMAPFSLYLKAMGGVSAAAKTAGAVKMAAADAMTMATNFDPHEERFADMLVDMGLDNAYLRYMTDPNETEAEGRFKNVIDSQVVNLAVATALGPVVWGAAKAFKSLRSVAPAAKAVKP